MSRPIIYGQAVVGPPGSGKTTYCDGMQQYLKLLGRNSCVINFDPANEITTSSKNDSNDNTTKSLLPYDTIYDVCIEAINLSSVMEQMNLGPNGGLLYCAEYIEQHSDEIINTIRTRINNDDNNDNNNAYLILDFPGQVELYTHSTCVQTLLHKMVKILNIRLTAVQLIDAHYCTDVTKFISAALLGTTTMIRLELPTVNVLSKVDILDKYGELPFQLDFFTECQDLNRLIPFLYETTNNVNDDYIDNNNNVDIDSILDDPDYKKAKRKREQGKFHRKYKKLHEALAEIVEDFSLLSFIPLDITKADSVGRVLAKIDKSNGYIFTQNSINEDLFQCAIQSDDISKSSSKYEALADVRERIASPDSIHELKKKS